MIALWFGYMYSESALGYTEGEQEIIHLDFEAFLDLHSFMNI